MKKIIIAICAMLFAIVSIHLVNGQARVKYCVLALEYIGRSDKPIYPIVISDSINQAEWFRTDVLKRDKFRITRIHTVNSSILNKMLLEIERFQINAKKNGLAVLTEESSTVRVTIVKSQNKESFLLNFRDSNSMLEALMGICRTDHSLRSHLLEFKEWLVYYNSSGIGSR